MRTSFSEAEIWFIEIRLLPLWTVRFSEVEFTTLKSDFISSRYLFAFLRIGSSLSILDSSSNAEKMKINSEISCFFLFRIEI